MKQPSIHIPAGTSEIFESIERYANPSPLLIVISGPSGVGKDSVIRRMRELRYPFHFVVTATDRPPRPGEVEGVDYYFLSTEQFEEMIAQNEFFEYARVYNQYKGVPKPQTRQALASGMDVIMRLDVQGAATIRAKVPQALTIFLAPPSIDVLVKRLQRRGGDSIAQVQKRLATAMREMTRMPEFDYVVINREGHLDQSAAKIAAIIQAAKCRIGRSEIEL